MRGQRCSWVGGYWLLFAGAPKLRHDTHSTDSTPALVLLFLACSRRTTTQKPWVRHQSGRCDVCYWRLGPPATMPAQRLSLSPPDRQLIMRPHRLDNKRRRQHQQHRSVAIVPSPALLQQARRHWLTDRSVDWAISTQIGSTAWQQGRRDPQGH